MEVDMESLAISKFKATCLAVLERVRKTRKSVLITRFGEPIAEIVPPTAQRRQKTWIGSMKGTARIKGDIVLPVVPPKHWEVLGH
jgi:prevent-host-death family protein